MSADMKYEYLNYPASRFINVYECDIGYEPKAYLICVIYCVIDDAYGMLLLRTAKLFGIRRDLI